MQLISISEAYRPNWHYWRSSEILITTFISNYSGSDYQSPYETFISDLLLIFLCIYHFNLLAKVFSNLSNSFPLTISVLSRFSC